MATLVMWQHKIKRLCFRKWPEMFCFQTGSSFSGSKSVVWEVTPRSRCQCWKSSRLSVQKFLHCHIFTPTEITDFWDVDVCVCAPLVFCWRRLMCAGLHESSDNLICSLRLLSACHNIGVKVFVDALDWNICFWEFPPNANGLFYSQASHANQRHLFKLQEYFASWD